MRDLAGEAMGVTNSRGPRDAEITDVQTTMASAHVGAAIPNSLAVEFHSCELGWWDDFVEDDVNEDASIEIPEKPGLCVTLYLDTVAANLVDGEGLFDPA